ncbi:MAG: hypothetical protein EZS28_048469, partial [Streblomastix strix]
MFYPHNTGASTKFYLKHTFENPLPPIDYKVMPQSHFYVCQFIPLLKHIAPLFNVIYVLKCFYIVSTKLVMLANGKANT